MALAKTVAMYEWSLCRDYDYIFRVNLGSYLDFEALYNYVKDKPRTRYYAGFGHSRTSNASGSGYYISRDLVELLIEKQGDIIPHVDDVAIGTLLIKNGVRLSPGIRYDIKNGVHHKLIGYEDEPLEIPDKPYHFRIRHEMGQRSKDVAIMTRMWRLHKKIGSPI